MSSQQQNAFNAMLNFARTQECARNDRENNENKLAELLAGFIQTKQLIVDEKQKIVEKEKVQEKDVMTMSNFMTKLAQLKQTVNEFKQEEIKPESKINVENMGNGMFAVSNVEGQNIGDILSKIIPLALADMAEDNVAPTQTNEQIVTSINGCNVKFWATNGLSQEEVFKATQSCEITDNTNIVAKRLFNNCVRLTLESNKDYFAGMVLRDEFKLYALNTLCEGLLECVARNNTNGLGVFKNMIETIFDGSCRMASVVGNKSLLLLGTKITNVELFQSVSNYFASLIKQ